MDVEELLAKHKNVILHAQADGGVGSNFDESRVKRDGTGRFAKQASGSIDPLDSEWMTDANLKALEAQIYDMAKPGLESIANRLAKKYGFASGQDAVRDIGGARDEYKKQALDHYNELASEVAVSPSGKKRLEFAEDRNGELTSKPVTNSDSRPKTNKSFKEKVVRKNLLQGDFEGETLHEVVGNFLEHYGIPGMKWGVRRKRGPGGTVSSALPKGGSKKDDDDEPKEIHVSADVERFVKTHKKQGYEMSDREIKEAVNRAKMVKEYNEIFGDNPSKALRTKVETLRLQKEYSQLHRQMNPTKLDRVNGLINSSKSGFQAFQDLDAFTGGELSSQLKVGMGLQSKYQPKHRANQSTRRK